MIFQWFKRHYRALGWESKILIGAAGLSLLPIAGALALRPGPEATTPEHAAPHVDTYIPKGFVLVPIEVQNYEALDSILGQFGVVDLFQSTTVQNSDARLVARNVRILRAPQNPTHFAVLVEESAVSGVLKFGSLFTVIVKRPEHVGTEFVKATAKRSIVYEGE